MTTPASELEGFPGLRGGAHFVAPDEVVRLRGALSAAGMILVSFDAPGPASRGRLADAIESAVEIALDRRGAAPPGVGSASDLDACLSDQLFRARGTGASGIALHVPPLAGVANAAGALDAEDSAVLRWWIAATRERPVVVLVDRANRGVGAYGPPVRLDELLGERAAAAPATPVPPPSGTRESGKHLVEPGLRIAVATGATGATREPSPDAEWRAWADELASARGPKPLAAIERLFVSRYVPLSEALVSGAADERSREVLEGWAAGFTKSFTEAFGALRVTGKRPPMVFDVPQLAGRLARLHGAKTTQLVLVDAMRFDLGLRVHERLRKSLGGFAACTERVVLWSALPSTTPIQLELLARGAEALAGPLGEGRDETVARGRNVTTMRRVKLGSRDVMKLDCAEARLAASGGPAAERLDAMADEVATALATHAKSLAPRTLLFVFGDHGFRFSPGEAGGTGPGRQGGASPEEVLVPGFAWVIGGVH